MSSDAEWQALVGIIGTDDPRFATEAARHASRRELDALVARWTDKLSADAAAEQLQAAGIAAHASWDTASLTSDTHLRTRRALVTVAESDGKQRAAVGVPMRLSKGADIGIHRGTPKLGEHEDYVYGELLGMSGAERKALEEHEVIY